MFDREVGALPPEIEAMAPGPELAACLDGIDVSRLSGHDRVVVLEARQRMASHYGALVYDAMVGIADAVDDREEPDRAEAMACAAAEIRAALRLTRRAADIELELALDLRRRLPAVWRMLLSGAIDVRRARAIVHGVTHLSIAAAREVVAQLIDEAPHLTTGQLAARIRRLCIDADPDEAKRRYEHAVADRRIATEATESGTSHLFGMDLPPDRVAAVARRINRLARSLRSLGETRTMDQLRADVFLDLLGGKHQLSGGGGGRGVVDMRVDLATLAELQDRAGDVAGYGPVIADIARQVAGRQRDAEWRFAVTDPDDGRLIHSGLTRRRPTNAQRREVEIRDQACVFPGCRMPAAECDLDHRIPWSIGGLTSSKELAPLCRHDHVTIRHVAGWSYVRLPDGSYRWRSKLGRTYITRREPP